jgi:hypothetical protein
LKQKIDPIQVSKVCKCAIDTSCSRIADGNESHSKKYYKRFQINNPQQQQQQPRQQHVFLKNSYYDIASKNLMKLSLSITYIYSIH